MSDQSFTYKQIREILLGLTLLISQFWVILSVATVGVTVEDLTRKQEPAGYKYVDKVSHYQSKYAVLSFFFFGLLLSRFYWSEA